MVVDEDMINGVSSTTLFADDFDQIKVSLHCLDFGKQNRLVSKLDDQSLGGFVQCRSPSHPSGSGALVMPDLSERLDLRPTCMRESIYVPLET